MCAAWHPIRTAAESEPRGSRQERDSSVGNGGADRDAEGGRLVRRGGGRAGVG